MRASILLSSKPILRYLQRNITHTHSFLNLFSTQANLNEETHILPNNHRPIIAFDLDNTLICTTRIKTLQTDFTIYTYRDNLMNISKRSIIPIDKKSDNLEMPSQKKITRSQCSIHVQLRPGAIKFINEVSKIYEIFFYTSSLREVAIEIVKIIAPDVNEDHILAQESCIFIEGYEVKDLTKIMSITGPVEMTKILLIDDVLGSGLFQPLNIVGISSWEGEIDDEVLERDLLPLLIECGSKENVVKEVRNRENGLPSSLTLYNY